MTLGGCRYEEPLDATAGNPIDPMVLGLWELQPDDGDDDAERERMLVLPLSANEYLVNYPTGEDGLYFRAYPIKVGGVSCIQLKLLGTQAGALPGDDDALYDVVTYALTGGGLEVKTLNQNVISTEIETTDSLVKAFAGATESPELFSDPCTFTRIKNP